MGATATETFEAISGAVQLVASQVGKYVGDDKHSEVCDEKVCLLVMCGDIWMVSWCNLVYLVG